MAVRGPAFNFIPAGVVTIATAYNGTLPAVDITIGVIVNDTDVVFSDVTTGNASTLKHGFLRKLDGVSTHYLDGTGAWSTPPPFDASTQTSGWMPLTSVVGGEPVLVWDAGDTLIPTFGPF